MRWGSGRAQTVTEHFEGKKQQSEWDSLGFHTLLLRASMSECVEWCVCDTGYKEEALQSYRFY